MEETISDIIDELHVKISSIQIRLSKLEQYARLQEDLNRSSIHYIHKKPPTVLYGVDKNVNLTFEEALKAYKQGKQIKRREWPSNWILELKNTCNFWAIGNLDLIANDWEIVS